MSLVISYFIPMLCAQYILSIFLKRVHYDNWTTLLGPEVLIKKTVSTKGLFRRIEPKPLTGLEQPVVSHPQQTMMVPLTVVTVPQVSIPQCCQMVSRGANF